jgi:3-phenylpropionate/trans-cinnamate dioxygenase ferredoxin reductase subunit
MADRTFVIVGAGMAGAKAAETLREEGFDGRVVLVGAEPEAPYERPPLSKGYLIGDSAREEARVHDAGFYEQRDIELRDATEATAIDTGAHTVTLGSGEELAYDRLLIATGAIPKRPPIPGADLDHVRVLRSLADSDALREAFGRGGSLAVIGGGWIGCEVAAAARGYGVKVTLIEQAEQPLAGVLGAEVGAIFAAVHREKGVDVVTDAKVERIDADAVQLGGGRSVVADLVLLGVGVAPDTRLAEAAGIELDNGIVCDERLRTSAPDVYAAGDVANALRPRYGRRVRVEHWANALEQGPAAARSMLDGGEPFDDLPFFFSDQYEVGMEYYGLHSPDDAVELQGDVDGRQFRAVWTGSDGRVTAAMHVNDWDASDEVKQLVESGSRRGD